MTSIPQLRKDLNDTQRRLHDAELEITRLRSMPPVTVYTPVDVPRLVTKQVTIEKDSASTLEQINKLREHNKKLQAELEKAKSAVTVREVVKEVPVIEYRDNPKHIEMIKKLREKLKC